MENIFLPLQNLLLNFSLHAIANSPLPIFDLKC